MVGPLIGAGTQYFLDSGFEALKKTTESLNAIDAFDLNFLHVCYDVSGLVKGV